MNLLKTLFLSLTVASVAFAAPSKAAPAKNSTASIMANAQNRGYSAPTRDKFLKSCKEGVEAPICDCVLKKLEAKYDEATFNKYESELAKGKEDAAYVNFIVQSTTDCGEALDAASAAQNQGSASAGLGLAAEDLMIFKAILQSPMFKDNFVQSCTVQSMEWLGANQADKSCNCAFDRLIKDDKFIGGVIGSMGADGSDFNIDKWGYDFIEPCLPKQFPAEMDNAFIKECLKAGDANKATCECVLKSIKKDYSVRSLMKTAIEDEKKLELDITLKAAQCLSK
jgi:hypothetical protein